MSGALLAVEHARDGAAFDRHPRSNRAPRIGEQGVDRLHRLAQWTDQFVAGGRAGGFGGCGKRHKWAPILRFDDPGWRSKLTRAVHKSQLSLPACLRSIAPSNPPTSSRKI